MTTSLQALQRIFQARLLAGGDDVLLHLKAGGAFMKVYDRAYTARLIEVLSADFEGLHTLLGDEQFAEAMRGYVEAHPSSKPSIRWLGANLADWLAGTEPWSDHQMLMSMAAFEWMLGLAFDAPDAAPISISEIATVPPEAWPMLTFTVHPALHTTVLSADVAPFYQAIKAEMEPSGPPAPYDAPITWAAWRDPRSLMVVYRELAVDEAAAIAAATDGLTFDAMCEVIANNTEADEAAVRAAGLLRNWIENGWIIGLDADGMSW